MIQLLFQNRRLLGLLTALLIVAGLGALYTLPIAEDPRMENRFALILTPFPGASATRVEALVTEKLEQTLREMPEIKEISSRSGNGMSSITLSLIDSITDPDPVWTEWSDPLNPSLNESHTCPAFGLSEEACRSSLPSSRPSCADPTGYRRTPS